METKLEVVYLPIDSLTPYEKNARKHKEFDVAVIKKSIEQFGFDDPIGVWGNKNIIVEGHGRLLAARELGFTEVPCIRLDHLNDEQRKAYSLTHNRSAELSSWDFDILEEELKELEKEFELEDLGFGEFLQEEEVEFHDDDFDESAYITDNPSSRVGDLYVLGDNRLFVGDSKSKENVDLLVNNQTIDFILTDPPYNVDYEGKTVEKLKIDNDNMTESDFYDLLYCAFSHMVEHAKPGANFFVFHSDSQEIIFREALEKAGAKWHQTWQWIKNSIVLGHGWAHYQNEPIWVGWKEGAAHFNTGRRDLSTKLEFDRPTRSLEHPTMKPLDLLGYLIQEGSKKGDLCLDLFGGSGSTLIACEEAGRKCYIAEKKPVYGDVIVKRYLRYKGTKEGCYLIRNGEKMELPQEFISVLD